MKIVGAAVRLPEYHSAHISLSLSLSLSHASLTQSTMSALLSYCQIADHAPLSLMSALLSDCQKTIRTSAWWEKIPHVSCRPYTRARHGQAACRRKSCTYALRKSPPQNRHKTSLCRPKCCSSNKAPWLPDWRLQPATKALAFRCA